MEISLLLLNLSDAMNGGILSNKWLIALHQISHVNNIEKLWRNNLSLKSHVQYIIPYTIQNRNLKTGVGNFQVVFYMCELYHKLKM